MDKQDDSPAAPGFFCPSCECPLHYERSRANDPGDRLADLSDYYRCPAGCGTFEYANTNATGIVCASSRWAMSQTPAAPERTRLDRHPIRNLRGDFNARFVLDEVTRLVKGEGQQQDRTTVPQAAAVAPLNVVLNWFQELK